MAQQRKIFVSQHYMILILGTNESSVTKSSHNSLPKLSWSMPVKQWSRIQINSEMKTVEKHFSKHKPKYSAVCRYLPPLLAKFQNPTTGSTADIHRTTTNINDVRSKQRAPVEFLYTWHENSTVSKNNCLQSGVGKWDFRHPSHRPTWTQILMKNDATSLLVCHLKVWKLQLFLIYLHTISNIWRRSMLLCTSRLLVFSSWQGERKKYPLCQHVP
jgi:hypothetical protein